MAKRIGVSPKVVNSQTDLDGNPIGNKILLGLSDEDRSQVVSRMEFVRLNLHQVLHEAGESGVQRGGAQSPRPG